MCRSMHSGCGTHVGYRGDSHPRGSLKTGGAMQQPCSIDLVETLHFCRLCIFVANEASVQPRSTSRCSRFVHHITRVCTGGFVENPLGKQVATRMGICEFKITCFPVAFQWISNDCQDLKFRGVAHRFPCVSVFNVFPMDFQ